MTQQIKQVFRLMITKQTRQRPILLFAFLILLPFLGCESESVMGEQDIHGETAESNRLLNEKSPYLLQHAHNPVDWYPWGDAAFDKAREEDKPVFLSIGYSTCHWCHVMERESFEDEEVAGLMNEVFVSIKVDREERPDIDTTYMTVAQLMTGRGGWPLTIIMTPEKKPFFAATYIPKSSRQGMPGMLDLIPRVQDLWLNRREEIEDSAESIVRILQETGEQSFPGEPLSSDHLDTAFHDLADSYDQIHGGFGRAPKFPAAHNLIFLIRYWERTGETRALDIAEHTLQVMRLGGIYDHVGFGFHRYSTDREWLVPHFEKMLYDQAMLSMAYLEAHAATGKEEYAETAREIFTYVLRDLRGIEGAFHSAEDADSEGVEGKFYLWSKSEIDEALGPLAPAVVDSFNVAEEGNYTVEATGIRNGANIFHLTEQMEDSQTVQWSKARSVLFDARERRIRPLKDDKVLTDWNGLMIAALAKGGRILDEGRFTEAASGAADFVLSRMRDSDGRLFHRYREGEAALQANLADYSFFSLGLLELYQTTFESRYLQEALSLLNLMAEYFWDHKEGGFYFTPEDGEQLLGRRKESIDSALPSGNSVALQALTMASRITADSKWEEMANRTGSVFSQLLSEYPSAHTYFLTGGLLLLGPSYEIVVVGKGEDKDTRAMLDVIRSVYLPNKVVIRKDISHDSAALSEMVPYIDGYTALDGRATAYVCQGFVCELPTSDLETLRNLLRESSGSLR
jgi:uncharacterized protein YyaL (SSP411 family)